MPNAALIPLSPIAREMHCALGDVSALHVNHTELICHGPNTTTKGTEVCVQCLTYILYSLSQRKENPVFQLIWGKDTARHRFLLVDWMLESFSYFHNKMLY